MAGELSQSALNLSHEEKRAYGHLFQQADTEGVGVVTGEVAVKFFEKTKLEATTLGEIWQIGDAENRGFLTPAGFSVVLRLIGHCQAGREPSVKLATQTAPLPRFDGMTLPGQSQSGSTPAPQQPPAGAIRVPPLSSEKVNEYSALFERAGARNGALGGVAAKQIFEKAELPNEALSQIWNLADRDLKGQLNETEFVIAMHLLASMRNGSMRALPQSLPPGLYEAASRRAPQSPVATSIPRQFSAQAPQRTQTQSPLARSFGSPPVSAQSTGSDWLITPPDKAKFDQAFASVDRAGRGQINGDQAVAFFSNSGLSEETLATIWDLADINSEGHLTRDEFAVAMYLIRQQRGMTSDRGNLPTSLPPRLVPPSMRQRSVAPSQPTAPSFDNAAFASQQPQSAANDLFGLDALSTDSTSTQSPAKSADPFAGAERATSPTSPPRAPPPPQSRAPGAGFKPFVPTSSFGQGLAAQNTGDSVQSNRATPRADTQQRAGNDDLLGDTDPDVSSKFNAETTELANMSNQIGTLHKQMQEVQSQKPSLERDVAVSSSQKRELEDRLAQFRSQYETEVKAVKTLGERLNISKNETRKLGQDLAMLEGAHQDLQAQHQQLATAFEADQKENMQLKEKIRQTNAVISQLRPALEKLKSDARQQKGMTAINKKQLATNETESEKLVKEKAELEKANQEGPADASSAREVPGSGIVSPAASAGGQSMNPFFRKPSQQSGDRSMSPASFKQDYASPGPSAFDSFFGPSDADQHTSPPPTSFGNSTQRAATPTTQEKTPVTTPPVAAEPTSSSISGLRTPPRSERIAASETPRTFEPPPPPESRQITSSALPFRGPHLQAHSPTSSVQANPPASRSGASDIGGSSAQTGSSSASSETGEDTPVKEYQRELTGTPQTGQTSSEGQANSRLDPRVDTVSHQKSHVPGAFPGDNESPAQLTPTGGSTTSEQSSRGLHQSGTVPGPKSLGQEPSSTTSDDPQQLASNSSQGESAARGMPSGKQTSSEFPPIQDLEPDESDSDSERGFDDHFNGMSQNNPAPPGAAMTDSNVSDRSVQPGEMTNGRPALQSNASTASAASQLPDANAQKSPPTYESTERSAQNENPSSFPPAFGSLLPSRDAPAQSTEPSQSAASSSLDNGPSLSSPPMNTASMPVSTELKGPTAAKAAAEAPGDDFDSAFDDLDEAKEADEQGQDSFGFSTASRARDDDNDFNPTFESPSVARQETPSNDSIQHTPTTSRDAGNHAFSSFDPSPPSNSVFNAPATSPFATSSAAGASQPTQFTNTSHDWDAIFSGLDKPVDVSASGANGPIQAGKSPFALDEPGNNSKVTAASGTPSHDNNNSLRSPPQLTRKISENNEHDDPILKRLTGMGFPRDRALAALEKYDYNLDKAADFLTFEK